MKIVFCAINSAYVHSNFAVRKLKKYINEGIIKEYTVNQQKDSIYSSLLLENADIYCFSSYIWNITLMEKIAGMLKKAINPIIIFGGPEASAEPMEFIKNNPFVDYVIKGEGEIALKELISSIRENKVADIEGVYTKDGGYGIAKGEDKPPMPYDENDIANLKDKMIYYETTRGCYNKCAYCVSSGEKYTFYDEEKVMRELYFLSNAGVKLIKLVDRSFNALKDRACRLAEFMATHTGDTTFHLEISPDILSDEFLEIIKNAPKGKFQFEAGIQSLNEETLKAVERKCDNEKALYNLSKIISFNNSEVHVDIIAGLPLEDLESFKNTFNKTYELSADMMSVGFLKVLKGTKMREIANDYGIEYENEPPYEVIKTAHLSAFELNEIKCVHEAVEKLYNSHAFSYFIKALEKRFPGKYEMYKLLGEDIDEGMARRKIYSMLVSKFPELKTELIFDFMSAGEKKAPEGFNEIITKEFSKNCIEFISENISDYFPELALEVPQSAYKKLKFYEFSEGVFMAKKEGGKVYDITLKFHC